MPRLQRKARVYRGQQMKWILIVWVAGGWGSPNPTPVASFGTEAECVAALAQWHGNYRGSYPGRCIYGEPLLKGGHDNGAS